MRLRLLTLIILSFIIPFNFSCKKSSSNTDPTTTGSVKLLTSITSSSSANPGVSGVVYSFKYDSKYRIIEELQGGGIVNKYSYDSNDRVIQYDNFTSTGAPYLTIKYSYITGGIAETDISYINGVASAGAGVSINLDNNQWVSLRDFGVQGPNHYYDQFIYDSVGNELSINSSGTGTTTFTYDQHKSPLINVKGYFYFFLDGYGGYFGKVNNVLTKTRTGNGVTTILYSYTYSYDNDGYPVSRSYTSNNVTTTETYNYSML